LTLVKSLWLSLPNIKARIASAQFFVHRYVADSESVIITHETAKSRRDTAVKRTIKRKSKQTKRTGRSYAGEKQTTSPSSRGLNILH
jgi:hypothetical protein